MMGSLFAMSVAALLVLYNIIMYPTQGDNRILHRKTRGLFFSQMPISGGFWG